VRQAVNLVERAEEQAFGARGTAGEDDRPGLGPVGRDQARHVLRHVLAVGVHQDNRLALAVRVDVGQADRERALVPDVAAEVE
jgi:hypothetical protein